MDPLRHRRWRGKIPGIKWDFDKHKTTFSVMRDVYSMLGEDSFGQTKKMFEMMDKDGDNKITEKEFIRASLEDPELTRMLSCRN